jgi:anti-sigma B factor antagonist
LNKDRDKIKKLVADHVKVKEMTMLKANIVRDAFGNIIVQMQGDFDYDNCLPVRLQLQELCIQNTNTQITIDLGGVDFVGSSGLCHFVETIQIIKKDRPKHLNVELCNIDEDFRKLLRLYEMDEQKWDEAFGLKNNETSQMASLYANRKRTFEN